MVFTNSKKNLNKIDTDSQHVRIEAPMQKIFKKNYNEKNKEEHHNQKNYIIWREKKIKIALPFQNLEDFLVEQFMEYTLASLWFL